MKIEIWSDVMCPFCYIGKRHLEKALKEFEEIDQIEIAWKSFQLNPDLPEQADPEKTVYQHLAEAKGMSYEQSVQMHQNVVEMARNAGLNYNFDKAVVANSFKSHRLLQIAKTKGLGDALEERLFSAYFTEGKDTSSDSVLIELGKEIGLSEAEVNEALTNQTYAELVKDDIQESRQIGVTGVPFFVFDRKYAVSGAQPPEVFTQVLEKSIAEFKDS
ncbi:MAG: DsbA family oxidoreductase [Balneolaceae bacterium]